MFTDNNIKRAKYNRKCLEYMKASNLLSPAQMA